MPSRAIFKNRKVQFPLVWSAAPLIKGQMEIVNVCMYIYIYDVLRYLLVYTGVCVRAEELTTTATMKMAAARTPAAKYALCNSMGLLSTTDEPKVLSLKFLAFTSSTINSLELTTVSTTNSSAHSEANMQRENECKWLVPAGMTVARGRRNRRSGRRMRRSSRNSRKPGLVAALPSLVAPAGATHIFRVTRRRS